MILLIGATGQVGTAILRRLVGQGAKVRALTRSVSRTNHLQHPNVEFVKGDLRDKASLAAACRGVEAVIASATTTIPQGNYSFAAVDGQGYADLIAEAKAAAVGRFVFVSVPVTPYDAQVPTFHYKRLTERRLQDSGLTFTILRCRFIMDDWLSLLGSSIPLRGAESSTMRRNYWFSRLFFGAVGHLIENRGIALVPGSGRARHQLIAIDDIGQWAARALTHERARNAVLEIGGPEALSWDEVVAIFSRVLGRPVRPVHLPTAVFRAQQLALSPFAEAAANLMGLNRIAGDLDLVCDSRALAADFGIDPLSVEQYLRRCLA